MIGEAERRLLDLERKTIQLPTVLNSLEQRTTALEQGLNKSWGWGSARL